MIVKKLPLMPIGPWFNLTTSIGIQFIGGSNVNFEEVSVNGLTRAPTESEMKLQIPLEYVKAFHGEQDKKILSLQHLAWFYFWS